MPRTSILLLSLAFWFGLGGAAIKPSQAAKRRGAMIVSPKRDKEVTRTQEVIGKLLIPGKPIVLVRPVKDNGTWWVQAAPKLSERGYFRTEVRFGDSDARKADRFEIIVLVLRSNFELELFKDLESLSDLPEATLKSEEIPVVLSEDAKAETSSIALNAKVLKPRQDQKVQRAIDIIGRVDEGLKPVVLIRVDDPGGLWWIQDSVQMGEGGYFKSAVRFGNKSTPPGTRFRLVVMTPRAGRELAQLKTDKPLSDLPEEIPRSKTITVELDVQGAK